MKRREGEREGGNLLAIAKRPDRADFFHSWVQSLVVMAFARLSALVRVVLMGAFRASSVAFLARESALSLPWMFEWLGHQERVMLIVGLVDMRLVMVWEKVAENSCPAEGFRFRMDVSADEQSEKMWMALISGCSRA